MFYEIGPVEKIVIILLLAIAIANYQFTWSGLLFLVLVLGINYKKIVEVIQEKLNKNKKDE